ncbi:MAG: hypothetical protein V1913_17275 [Fibrobacterota bacterium]
MPIEPLKPKPQSGTPEPTSVSNRDIREIAVKASKDRDKTRLQDESQNRTRDSKRLNEQSRTKNIEAKKEVRDTALARQERTAQENKRVEERKNPNAGNIVNVVA